MSILAGRRGGGGTLTMEAGFSSKRKILFISKRGTGTVREHQAVCDRDYESI